MDAKTRMNLLDAGCGEAFIAEYDALCGCARTLRLKEHRRQLLDDIHASQKKLECLDFLIYQLRCEAECDSKE